MRIKPLTDNNTNRKTGRASVRNEVTFVTPKIKNITFAPTCWSLKTQEVDNSNRSRTFDRKPTHSSTDHTSKYMEVADNLHQLDKVITDDMRVKTSPTMAQSIPTLKHVTVAPTCRSLKTPDLGDNNRANLIRDDSVINGIITTCKLYYKPDTQPTVDSVRKVLTDAYESTDESCGAEEAIEWAHDFEIPASTVASDMKNFRAAGLDFNHGEKTTFP